MITTLTDQQRTTIAHALRVAAGRYRDDAAVCREDKHQWIGKGVAEQFDTQEAEALALADAIEGADVLTLEVIQ